jgi:hypothetical protein
MSLPLILFGVREGLIRRPPAHLDTARTRILGLAMPLLSGAYAPAH